MKLEQQVCSLELAKKLKELGAKPESYFVWEGADEIGYVIKRHVDSGSNISAFTVAELVRFFPRHVTIQIRNNRPDETRLMVEVAQEWFQEDGDSTSDTLATMLIYLLENKLITL